MPTASLRNNLKNIRMKRILLFIELSYFVNNKVGFIVGSNGTILKTKDAGNEDIKTFKSVKQ